MLGHRDLNLQDYSDILKRRLWLIVTSALVFFGLGVALTFVVPAQFESQTLVIVQQPKVPENYVKPVITEDLSIRLASMKEQILSRSRLEPIIDRYDLFAGKNASLDARVDGTRKAIAIKPISSGTGKMPGFYITFREANPHVAQQVCADITSLFLSESLFAREQSAAGTTAFLSQQVAEAKRRLDDQDAKFAAFQKRNIGRLPDQEQANLNTLQALTTQLAAVTQSLDRMEQDETVMSAMIAQQSGELQHNDAPGTLPPNSLDAELGRILMQKKELIALYTPDHPDVLALDRKIADLKREMKNPASRLSTEALNTEVRPEPPQLQQSKAQLRVLRQSIAAQKTEQSRLSRAVHTSQARIEATPEVESEFKQVTRDHDTALQFYNSLLTKMNESSMATDLEKRQQGEQFQVLDPANLPDSPIFPNRFKFAAGGFVLGVFIGLLIAAGLEYRDSSLRDEKDILYFTKLPTLASISLIDTLSASAASENPPSHNRTNKALNLKSAAHV